jgi:SAM-dependent methyltransferase
VKAVRLGQPVETYLAGKQREAQLATLVDTGTEATTVFEYLGEKYPEYLKHGNACRFIALTALQFCKGRGVDVGAGKWPLPGAIPIDQKTPNYTPTYLPPGPLDYVFSSHCLEHLVNPVQALEHWHSRLRSGGCVFLYLPSTQMRYWNTTRNRKHLHEWEPQQMARMLTDLGFVDVLYGERDLAWSFACVGWK